MRAIGSNITGGLTIGSFVNCDDNSGAKIVQIIGIKGAKARLRRVPKTGVGGIVVVSVKKGQPKVRKQKFLAVIIRQKKEYRRPNGIRVSFEDNACALVDDQYLPKATEIKGAVAREVATRFPKVAGIAQIII